MRFLSNYDENLVMPEGIIDQDYDNARKKKYVGKDFKPLYDALSNVKT